MPRRRARRRRRARPPARRTIATATARLSAPSGWAHPLEQPVEREDLRPVGVLARRRLVVHRGDRRLELVRPDGRCASAPLDERDALGDQRAVPERPVLLVERDELAVRPGARRPAGVGEQHEREQAGDLAVVGQQPVQRARQPDRFVGEIGALQVGARRWSRSPR